MNNAPYIGAFFVSRLRICTQKKRLGDLPKPISSTYWSYRETAENKRFPKQSNSQHNMLCQPENTMTTIDRILYSREHSFIALRSNSAIGAVLVGLAALTIAVLPSIIA